MTFESDAAYRLHDRVALRREPFGALAYHYDTRRLNFLHTPELAALVESLRAHVSARAAFDASGIDPQRWPSFSAALESLAGSGFLVADEPDEVSAKSRGRRAAQLAAAIEGEAATESGSGGIEGSSWMRDASDSAIGPHRACETAPGHFTAQRRADGSLATEPASGAWS